MSSNESEAVIARLKQVFNVSTDIGLCEQLNVSPQTLSSWKSRHKIPYSNCVMISQKKNISLDWLLMGRGAMIVGSVIDAPNPTAESHFSLSDLTLLALMNQLDPKVREHLMRDAQEKQRIIDIETELRELSDALKKMKKAN